MNKLSKTYAKPLCEHNMKCVLLITTLQITSQQHKSSDMRSRDLPTNFTVVLYFFLSQSLENANLASQPDLERLDVSRNNIANIAPGTFLGLSHLRELDLSVNALRTVSSQAMQLRPSEIQQFTAATPVKMTTVCRVSLSHQ